MIEVTTYLCNCLTTSLSLSCWLFFLYFVDHQFKVAQCLGAKTLFVPEMAHAKSMFKEDAKFKCTTNRLLMKFTETLFFLSFGRSFYYCYYLFSLKLSHKWQLLSIFFPFLPVFFGVCVFGVENFSLSQTKIHVVCLMGSKIRGCLMLSQ